MATDDKFSPGDFDDLLAAVDQALADGKDKDAVEDWALGQLAKNDITKLRTLGEIRRANLDEGGEGGIVRGMAQGATFGLADEIRGLGAAIMPGGEGGWGRDAYRAAQQRSQAGVERFRREHPVQAGLSEAAGSMLVPGLGTVGLARTGRIGFRGLTSANRIRRGVQGGLLGTAGATARMAGEAEQGLGNRVSAAAPGWMGGEGSNLMHPLSAITGGVFTAAAPAARAMGAGTATQAARRGPPLGLQSPIGPSPAGPSRAPGLLNTLRDARGRLRSPIRSGDIARRPQGQATGEMLVEQTGRGVIPPPRTATIPSAARPGPLPEPSGLLLPMRGAQGGATDVAGEAGAVINRAKLQSEGLEKALEIDRKAVYGPLDDLYSRQSEEIGGTLTELDGWMSSAAVNAGHVAEEAVVDVARANARELVGALQDQGLNRVLTGKLIDSTADKDALVQVVRLLSSEVDAGLNPTIKGMQALRSSLRNLTRGRNEAQGADELLSGFDDIMGSMFPRLADADEIFKQSSQLAGGFNLGAGVRNASISFSSGPKTNLSLGKSVDELRGSVDEVMDIVKGTGGDLAHQKEVAAQFLDGLFHRTIIAPLQTTDRAAVVKKLQDMMETSGGRAWLRVFFDRAPEPQKAFAEFERQFARDVPAAVEAVASGFFPKAMELMGGLGQYGLLAAGRSGTGVLNPASTLPFGGLLRPEGQRR
jgi:hypothetical protein